MTTSVVLACGVTVVLLALLFFYYTRRASRRRHQQQQQSPTLSSMSPDALGFTNGTANYDNSNKHPFNGTCPGLPGWAGTRKVKPIWILLKQETVSGSGISWAVCKSAPRSRQITMPAPHHSVFTGRMPFLPPNQQRKSTEGHLQLCWYISTFGYVLKCASVLELWSGQGWWHLAEEDVQGLLWRRHCGCKVTYWGLLWHCSYFRVI